LATSAPGASSIRHRRSTMRNQRLTSTRKAQIRSSPRRLPRPQQFEEVPKKPFRIRCVESLLASRRTIPGAASNGCRIRRPILPAASSAPMMATSASKRASMRAVLWKCTVRTQEGDFSPALGDPSQTEIGASNETCVSVRSQDGHPALTREHGDAGCGSFT
jgi:hypothetical protein